MLKATLYYLIALKKNQWEKEESLQKLKWQKLIENINYAYEHVPYYRNKFDKAVIKPSDIKNSEDIKKLPITTKYDILGSELRYISDEFVHHRLYTSRTSGSTGEPFVSYFDKQGWFRLKLASKYRARNACGFSFRERFVIIEAMPIKEAQNYNASFSISNLLFKKKILSLYDSMHSHVIFYKKFKPQTLYGFPSYFVNLVSYLEKNSIKLNSIERIFTSSEVLNKSSRELIENYFKCKVYDIYGCTETKEVAWECPKHEGYHINEDLVYVECIDSDGNNLEEGEIGKLVVTTFENKAMPLIRYFNGDMGKLLKRKCSCGRTFALMQPTYGRINDYFTLKDNTKVSPYELTMSVEDIKGIIQYQIIQKSPSRVNVYLRTNKEYLSSSHHKIMSNFKKILGREVKVNIIYIDEFNNYHNNNNSRNKFRVVISEVKNDMQN